MSILISEKLKTPAANLLKANVSNRKQFHTMHFQVPSGADRITKKTWFIN